MAFGYTILGFGSGGRVFDAYDADYLVLAGGGAAGPTPGGGGGAGGYRTSFPGGTKISLDNFTIPIDVGAGAYEGTGSTSVGITRGYDSTIELASGNFSSSGGGSGVNDVTGPDFNDGGSGGGTPHKGATGGTGNIGGYTPAEGTDGGFSGSVPDPGYGGSGGGGHTGAGSNAAPGASGVGGNGGNGTANSITAASVTRAGGGGGAGWITSPAGGTGGTGGGAPGQFGNPSPPAVNGTDELGGGGGGAVYVGGGVPGGSGGTGIVIIRIPAANAPAALAVAPGTNTVATDSPTGDKICTFTVDGILTLG